MYRITFLIIILLSVSKLGCAQKAYSVKIMREYDFYNTTTNTWEQEPSLRRIYYYDKSGLLTKEVAFLTDSSKKVMEYDYDLELNCIGYDVYNQNGDFIKRIESIDKKSGKKLPLVIKRAYDFCGQKSDQVSCEYDSNGNLIMAIKYDDQKEKNPLIKLKFSYEYWESGNR